MDATAGLPPDAVARAKQQAKNDGLFAGLSGALASALIGARFMGFNRNKTIFAGVLSGVLSGYLFTQAFTDTQMAQLRAEFERSKKAGNGTPTSDSEFSS